MSWKHAEKKMAHYMQENNELNAFRFTIENIEAR